MKITFRDRPIIFIDLEASGLHKDSYPIEVGWCADDERAPESFLIRPAIHWRPIGFSQQAFQVHGISWDTLFADGIATRAACDQLASAWANAILVTDNPHWDGKWLKRLYEAADHDYPWRLSDINVIASALAITHKVAPENLAEIELTIQRRYKAPHRAGPDALRLARLARVSARPRRRTCWRFTRFPLGN